MTEKNDKKEQSKEPSEGPTESEEKEPAEGEQEGPIKTGISGGNFFSPEIVMFVPAILLDATGVILLFFALDDFFITDIVGIIVIGGWIYFRSQTLKVTKGAAEKIGKAGKWAKRMKWLRPLLIIGELIPYVGALPCWILLVYFELQN